MKRKFVIAATISLITISLTVGIWTSLQSGTKHESTQFTYPILVGDKTFILTVVTNWSEEQEPSVILLNSSDNRHPIELYFLGGSAQKSISFKIDIPTDLLWGNISLIRKYYPVNPDNYILFNNGTYNSLEMTFDYQPFSSGSGYFEILGTEGAW